MTELERMIEVLRRSVGQQALEKAIEELRRPDAAKAGISPEHRDRLIRELLLNAGIPASVKGYRYGVTAINLLLDHPEMADAITKELYPRVAQLHNSTPSRVERAIRFGIETAWTRGDLKVLYGYFRNSVSGCRGKTTNSEFLIRMADIVRDQMAA